MKHLALAEVILIPEKCKLIAENVHNIAEKYTLSGDNIPENYILSGANIPQMYAHSGNNIVSKWQISWKVLDHLRLYNLFFSIRRDWTVLRRTTRLFYFSNTVYTTHCYFLWKRPFGGEGAVWYLVWVYMYLEVGTTHFYRFGLT